MGQPILEGRRIPVAMDGEVVNVPFEIEGKTYEMTCVSMGNPHAVFFASNVARSSSKRSARSSNITDSSRSVSTPILFR